MENVYLKKIVRKANDKKIHNTYNFQHFSYVWEASKNMQVSNT